MSSFFEDDEEQAERAFRQSCMFLGLKDAAVGDGSLALGASSSSQQQQQQQQQQQTHAPPPPSSAAPPLPPIVPHPPVPRRAAAEEDLSTPVVVAPATPSPSPSPPLVVAAAPTVAVGTPSTTDPLEPVSARRSRKERAYTVVDAPAPERALSCLEPGAPPLLPAPLRSPARKPGAGGRASLAEQLQRRTHNYGRRASSVAVRQPPAPQLQQQQQQQPSQLASSDAAAAAAEPPKASRASRTLTLHRATDVAIERDEAKREEAAAAAEDAEALQQPPATAREASTGTAAAADVAPTLPEQPVSSPPSARAAAEFDEAQLLDLRYKVVLHPPQPSRAATYMPNKRQEKQHRELVAAFERAVNDAEKARSKEVQQAIRAEDAQAAALLSKQKKQLAALLKSEEAELRSRAKREGHKLSSEQKVAALEAVRRDAAARNALEVAAKRNERISDSMAAQAIYIAKRAALSQKYLGEVFALERAHVAAQHETLLQGARQNLAYVAKAEERTFVKQLKERQKRRRKEGNPMTDVEIDKERTTFFAERDRIQAERIAKMEEERERHLARLKEEQERHAAEITSFYKSLIEKVEGMLERLGEH